MRVYNDGEAFAACPGMGTVLALGSFDALHIAHRQLICDAVQYAKQNNLLSGVLLFDRRPECVIRPEELCASLYTNADKCKIIAEMGVGFVYFIKFDEAFRNMRAGEFAEMLKEKFHAVRLVVGEHYHFGRNAEGDAQTLKMLGGRLGFDVAVSRLMKVDQTLVSSTHIRMLLGQGDVGSAARFLGRYYAITGRVQADRGVGRQLNAPTANLIPDPSLVRLRFGVYATFVSLGGRRYRGVTNVGIRPTFSLGQYGIETHILDFDGDIYGQEITLEFVRRLRDEIRFESQEELAAQIAKDIRAAKDIL